jgi:tRNA modification GTPase
VRNAIHALERFHEAHKSLVVGEELLSEYLREALDELGYLMGKFDIEEVLGELFSSFCIGK